MLKITLHDSARELQLKLEGRLSGLWVHELEQCWQTASSTTQGRKTVVDLGEVDFVDPAGESLLARMHAQGVELVAVTPSNPGRLTRGLSYAGLWYGGKSRLDALMPSTAPLSPDPTRARYETLLEVAESIVAHRQLSTLFTDLSRLLKRLVPFDFISLTLIDTKERVVRLHILESEQPIAGKPPKSTPFEQTPTIAALQSRRPYYIPDTAEESRFPVIREILRANGIQSACILPLFTAQREIGGLHFGSLARNAYSEETIEFMGQVARQVAVAVDNALHSEAAVAYEAQLAHERDRLRTLLEVNNAVVGCLETRELFQAISASLRRTFGLDYASLLIYDPEAAALRLHMLDFPDGTGAIREDAVVPLDSTPAGYVFRTRQGRVFSLEEARAISAATGDLFEREGIQSLCSRPLDLARHRPRHPECRLAPPRPLPGRRPGILHPGGRPGGHRAR